MKPEATGHGSPQWSPEIYLSTLNRTATYAATRGMPFLVVSHAAFMVSFVDAWLDKSPGSARKASAALFRRWPKWGQRRIATWLSSSTISNRALLLILLVPFALS